MIETLFNSTASGLWSRHDASFLIGMAIAVVASFALCCWVVQSASRAWHVDRSGRIAALFCDTTKSPAAGVPLAPAVFGQAAALGVLVAPIIMFHFAQSGIVLANHGQQVRGEALA